MAADGSKVRLEVNAYFISESVLSNTPPPVLELVRGSRKPCYSGELRYMPRFLKEVRAPEKVLVIKDITDDFTI
jgi:hypothetical protein